MMIGEECFLKDCVLVRTEITIWFKMFQGMIAHWDNVS